MKCYSALHRLLSNKLPNLTELHQAPELGWLIRLRWLAIALYAVIGLLAFQDLLLLKQFKLPFFGLIATLILFNLYSTSILRLRRYIAKRDIFLQVTVDTLILTALCLLSGGSKNPLILLYFVQGTIASILLNNKFRILYLFILICLVWLCFFFRNMQVISASLYTFEEAPVVFLSLSLASVYTLVSWLSLRLDKYRELKSQNRNTMYRLDRLHALGAMTRELSHRFASPLSTIKLRLNRYMRRSQNHTGMANEDLKIMQEAIEQCEQVLHEMADTSKVTDLETTVVKVADYVENLIKQWESIASTKVRRSYSDCDLKVKIPQLAFAQAFFNLLDNALQCGGGYNIEVLLNKEGNAVEIAVQDDGPGFSKEVLENFGKPFTSTRDEGTGLGLYNCLLLCEALGGGLSIENRKNGGAKAIILLPTEEP